jgi:hypothetical protein
MQAHQDLSNFLEIERVANTRRRAGITAADFKILNFTENVCEVGPP